MKEPINIPSIHDDDLKKVLISYNSLQEFENGQMHCYICDAVMNWENLGAIFLDTGRIKGICNEDGCIEIYNKKN
jgi:hypothetical protein